MVSYSVELDIPDKLPYEGKATQKQKQYIWDLGFQDEEVIDELGKKQASAIIDQLKRGQERVDKVADAVGSLILSGIVFVASTAAIICFTQTWVVVAGWICLFVSFVKMVAGLIKMSWHKSRLAKGK